MFAMYTRRLGELLINKKHFFAISLYKLADEFTYFAFMYVNCKTFEYNGLEIY